MMAICKNWQAPTLSRSITGIKVTTDSFGVISELDADNVLVISQLLEQQILGKCVILTLSTSVFQTQTIAEIMASCYRYPGSQPALQIHIHFLQIRSLPNSSSEAYSKACQHCFTASLTSNYPGSIPRFNWFCWEHLHRNIDSPIFQMGVFL